jgi:subtilisin family serine protease
MARGLCLVSFPLALVVSGCVQDFAGPRSTARLAVPAAAPEVVPDQLIVALRPGVDPGAAASEIALRHGGGVLFVEPDLPVHLIAQTLPTGVNRIDADLNATADIDGADDVRVDADIAIPDTGIDLDHPDLNVLANSGKNCMDSSAPPDDGHSHGTHVAGSAAALDNDRDVVGVAPGARLWPVKVLDNSGSGTISTVICGIDFVTANAAEIEVANMSLGAQGQSDALRTAIQNSVAKGVYYAVAAGNSGADIYGSDGVFNTTDDFIPAAYPEVATVSAMADYDGASGGNGGTVLFIGCGSVPDDTMVCFSNFSASVVSDNPVTSPGKAIDVAAPAWPRRTWRVPRRSTSPRTAARATRPAWPRSGRRSSTRASPSRSGAAARARTTRTATPSRWSTWRTSRRRRP